MIINTEIFNKKSLCIAGILAVLLSPAFAANKNGCEDMDGENDRINAEIALCSTHVYNIGETVNQSSESQKQLMHDVVALKTTVMTQQMYKQYEYLESMIRRFKTQLEKAVLTTKLQAAGADTSSAGSSSYSGVGSTSKTGTTSSRSGSNRYIVLNDAKNCSMESTIISGLQCLLSNIDKTLVAIDNDDISGAKRQLDADKEVASKFGIKDMPSECKIMSSNAKSLSSCAYALRIKIMEAIDTTQTQSRQNMFGIMAQQPSE